MVIVLMSVSNDGKLYLLLLKDWLDLHLEHLFSLFFFYKWAEAAFSCVCIREYIFVELCFGKDFIVFQNFLYFLNKYSTCPTSHEFANRLHLEILLNACVHLHVSLGIITLLLYDLMPKIPSCLTRRQSSGYSAMTVSKKCLLADILCASRDT